MVNLVYCLIKSSIHQNKEVNKRQHVLLFMMKIGGKDMQVIERKSNLNYRLKISFTLSILTCAYTFIFANDISMLQTQEA